MSFTLRYHPDVRKVDLPLLDERMKNKIRTAIEKRLQCPSGLWRTLAKNPEGVLETAGRQLPDRL